MSIATIDTAQTSAALAIRRGQDMWTPKQKAALEVLGIRGASNADLAVFMHYCQKTQLDPFSRQIYLIKRREKIDNQWVDKWTIQVGIDGFRVIRDRVAERLGVTFEYEDTIWYDADGGPHKVWLWDTPPAGCNVTVVKDGHRFPGVIRFDSYAQRNRDTGELTGQWRTQPDHMIEKCAEAFALRRAFPNDLAGVYLDDELPAPDPDAPAAVRARGRVTAAEVLERRPADPETGDDMPPDDDPGRDSTPAEGGPRLATPEQLTKLHTVYTKLGFDGADREQKLRVAETITGRAPLVGPIRGRSTKNLVFAEARALIDTLDGFADRGALVAFMAERGLRLDGGPDDDAQAGGSDEDQGGDGQQDGGDPS